MSYLVLLPLFTYFTFNPYFNFQLFWFSDLPRLITKNMAVWFLVISCFLSYGGSLGQAVICSGQQGQVVAFELFHNDNHCASKHKHHGNRHPGHENTVNFNLGDNCFTECNNIEVSLQLFALRRTTIKNKTDFIVKPIFQPSNLTHPVISPHQFSFTPKPPSVPNPSLALLQSVIILI